MSVSRCSASSPLQAPCPQHLHHFTAHRCMFMGVPYIGVMVESLALVTEGPPQSSPHCLRWWGFRGNPPVGVS